MAHCGKEFVAVDGLLKEGQRAGLERLFAAGDNRAGADGNDGDGGGVVKRAKAIDEDEAVTLVSVAGLARQRI